jgi:glucose-6-phosphate isomerase
MIQLKFRFDKASAFVSQDEVRLFESEISHHLQQLLDKTGKGNDFLGWVDLPGTFPADLTARLLSDASRIKSQSDIVVVCGIGGSYLGARAVTEALSGHFRTLLSDRDAVAPPLVYAGHHLDAGYMDELLRLLENRDYSVIVISKSGTTTEPAIAFRLLRAQLERKYGRKGAAGRIFAITDASKGALNKLATAEGYVTYEIPDDVGGRYSVLTPVGLLPIAAAGFDIRDLLEGARAMEAFLKLETGLVSNPAAQYAVARNILYRKGKTTEVMAAYNPSLYYLTEWWKQLFGESEGKENKGIFPAGVGFTTDLHSMGQYLQEGLRNIFETVIRVEKSRTDVLIPGDMEDLDGLNFLAGRGMDHVNRMAVEGTMLAHVDGGVPNLEITIPEVSAYTLGELIYFFEISCALSGYILGVNPFDQPGVEAYKKNMFALLDKPGFAEEGKKLRKRLK